jgi:hypothetical protein
MMTVAVKLQGEKDEYRKLRDRLLEAETALKDQRESVAALRRQLPMGPAVKTDYVFREGPADIHDESPANFKDVRLSELFAPGKDRLIVDHMMWGPNDKSACPMCRCGPMDTMPLLLMSAKKQILYWWPRSKSENSEIGPGTGDGAKFGCHRAASLLSTRISRLKMTEASIQASVFSAANLKAKSIIFILPKSRFTPPQTATQTTEASTSIHRSGISSTSCPKDARIRRLNFPIDW